MQTLNLQCGHCRNLMGVSVELLGQQVRCPHCGGVVVAPAAPAPEAPKPEAPTFNPLAMQQQQHEDIFSQQTETDDALFGADAPKIELPREPAPTPAVLPDLVTQPASSPTPEIETTAPVATWAPTNVSEPHVAPTVEPAGLTTEPNTTLTDMATGGPITPRKKAPPPIDWFTPLVFVPLILYAIVITGVSIFLYFRLVTQPPSLFEQMPDVGGDQPGIKKVELGFTKPQATAPLPDKLRVELGETLRLGDLEVTPLRVERKKMSVFVESPRREEENKAEPCQGDSLVLHLRIKNVAKDHSFVPIDNYFDRHWDGRAGSAPLTVLQVGTLNLFGGPAEWYPLKRDRSRRQDRQWVEGRRNGDYPALKPGETMETFVCTDGDSDVALGKLFGMNKEGKKVGQSYRGKFFWRVHLRRGVIDHNGRPRAATCVIGVEFTDKDVKHG